jgi:hypothetical protein
LFTFREAGMQVSPVTMSHPIQEPLLHPVYKEDARLFALGSSALRLLFLVFGLLAFWCERLLEGKRIVEGKRNAGGKKK